MKALILAGGKGTRLYPVTLETPKPLLTVRKKPIINYLVELFFSQKVEELAIVISTEHKEDFSWWYKRWFENWPIRLFEEPEPMGTFGGIITGADWLRNEYNFFVANADQLMKIDLSALKKFHEKHQGPATIALVEVDHPQDYGVAILDSNSKIKEFVEKPKNPPIKLVSSGLYVFSPQIFDYYDFSSHQPAMVEKDLFPKLAQEGKLYGFPYQGVWYDCGTFDRWQKAIEEWPG